jgi:hypothetical protein
MKENLIKALIDARSIEATKKKLSQKIITIAQIIGQPIIGQYGYVDIIAQTWEDDPDILDADEDFDERVLGFAYDSLKHGINFEIVIRTTGETVDTITVTYNQNVVYSEIDGVLKGYSPNLMWERHLEDLFSFAQKKEKELSKKQEIEDKIHKDHKKIALLNKLKLIWGF